MNRATCLRRTLALTMTVAASFLSAAPPAQRALILATTTSTQDSDRKSTRLNSSH